MYYLLSNSNYGQKFFPRFCNIVKITLMLLEKFYKDIRYSAFFLLLVKSCALQINLWSSSSGYYKVFSNIQLQLTFRIYLRVLLDFSDILMTLKGKLQLLSKRPIYETFILVLRSMKFVLALWPFWLCNSNCFGYISLKLIL